MLHPRNSFAWLKHAVPCIFMLVSCMSMPWKAFAQPMLRTVDRVDLDRYAGRWYEIARYPNRFQSHCTGQATAQYTKLDDDEIQVVNRCPVELGKVDEAEGRARIVDTQTNAKLEVRFAPSWLAWLPWVWGDYWIIDLASDYSYAVVGEPSRRYLWILARSAQLPDAAWQSIVERLGRQGYDPARLIRPPAYP